MPPWTLPPTSAAISEPVFYLLLFTAVLIEGPVATVVAAGAAVLDARYHLELVALISLMATLCADLCWYLVGRLGIMVWPLDRFRAAVDLEHLQGNGIRYLAGAKLGFGVAAIPVLLALGAARVAMGRLAPVALGCELLSTSILVGIGALVPGCLSWTLLPTPGILVALAVVVLLWARVIIKQRRLKP
jgi:hypothetical protein